MSEIEEKINLLRKEAKTNPEAETLLNVASLYYPRLFDNPPRITPNTKSGFNRLVDANITDESFKKQIKLSK